MSTKSSFRNRRLFSKKGVINYVDSFSKRISEFELAKSTGKKNIKKPKQLPINVALVSISERTAKKMGVKICTRGNNWQIFSWVKSFLHHRDGKSDYRGYGRWKTVSHAVNDNYVESFVIVSNPHKATFCICGKVFQYNLPQDMTFVIDSLGLHVKQGEDEYHVTAADVCEYNNSENFVAHVKSVIFALVNVRKEEARLAALEKLSLQGVYVKFSDSLNAGNCFAGTSAFCQRFSIDAKKPLEAEKLLDIARNYKDVVGRVKLAISRAARRHQQEMQQGFCSL